MNARTLSIVATGIVAATASVASGQSLLHSHTEDFGIQFVSTDVQYLTPLFATEDDDTGDFYFMTDFVGAPQLDGATPSGTTVTFDFGTGTNGNEWEQILTNGNGFDSIEFGFRTWLPGDVMDFGYGQGNSESNWVSPSGTTDLEGFLLTRVEVTLDNWLFEYNPNYIPGGTPSGNPNTWWQTRFGTVFTLDFYGSPIPSPGVLALFGLAAVRRRRRRI